MRKPWAQSILGKGNRLCKGPEAGPWAVASRDQDEAPGAGTEGHMGGSWGREVTAVH